MQFTSHPGSVGINMAMFVFPQADGKAAAINRSRPPGGFTFISCQKQHYVTGASLTAGIDISQTRNFYSIYLE